MSDSVAELEKLLESELQTFLSHHNNEKQPSESRRSRQLQDPHDGGQPSGARHSRPLEVPNDGKQPSGNKTWKSGAGSDPLGHNNLASVRGKTKGQYETLMYMHNGKWVPAVYHDTVRHYLIEEAKTHGEYEHPRERGIEPDNVTSFLESQKSWGPVRDENWADILYVFEKEEKNSPKARPVNWKVGSRVVLAGHDSMPILKYDDIPATLSTELAGRDMEAMKRTDPRIRQRDFIARMPMRYTTRTGRRRDAKSASWIGMEMTRFRQKHGMLSWVGREGSDVIRDALWDRLPKWNREENSIRGLAPPSVLEQELVREGNLGKFTKNAGVRALPDDERAKRQMLKKQRQLEKLRRTRSRTTSTSSGVDDTAGCVGGQREQHARDSRTQQDRGANERHRRPRPDSPDNTTRQDRGQEDEESDDESHRAPPKDGTRQRIGLRERHRPREHPQNPRERPSASVDRRMQPPESPTQDDLPPPPRATAYNYFDSEPPSPPAYQAYLERQALQRKAAQRAYK